VVSEQADQENPQWTPHCQDANPNGLHHEQQQLFSNVDPVTMRDFLISYESGQCHSV
jgi:hypothetical protein